MVKIRWNAQGGHGNDGEPGDKGDPNGSIYANSFYGMVLATEMVWKWN